MIIKIRVLSQESEFLQMRLFAKHESEEAQMKFIFIPGCNPIKDKTRVVLNSLNVLYFKLEISLCYNLNRRIEPSRNGR